MSTTGCLSDYIEDALLKALFRNTDFPASPATLYLAAFTTMPDDDGTGGTEVTTAGGTGYSRLSSTTGTAGTGAGSDWNAPTGGDGEVTNAVDLFFATATASWGSVVGVALYDDPTAGNMLARGTFDDGAVIISAGMQLKIPAGTLSLTVG